MVNKWTDQIEWFEVWPRSSKLEVKTVLKIELTQFKCEIKASKASRYITVLVYAITVTENPSNEGFRFLKLSEFKQWKSFVRIGRNFKAKMA